MVLIIAEKPSLARNIAAGIGKMNRHDGYLEGNGYIITWAFGHLFSLADIETYTGGDENAKWTMDNLPCFPDEFQFNIKKDKDKKAVDAGVQKQFNIITNLCNRNDVDTIVNAGDADREGEIIVRLCVKNALKSQKNLVRLWLPDQTPQTVAQALGEMKSESEYDNLANEGFARTYIDWLYGVNLTRYATLRTGKLLRVGRVIVPIVKAIYDRDMEIRNFKKDIYYGIASKATTNGEVVELTSKQKFDKADLEKAKALCESYNQMGAVVDSITKKKDVISAGKLYSLSKLQNVLGKKYKMSMADSLAIVQKLYEAGYLTYPRTNSEYLATAEKGKIKQILENCKKIGYDVEFKDKKTIFDDSKIESHSALTPTYKIPAKDALSEKEMKVYSTVFRRFVAVFCAEECLANKTEIKINVGDPKNGGEEFLLKGMEIVSKGWTKYDDFSSKDKILPSLSKGDNVNVLFAPVEKETTPPKHYTIETLNNYLKNPFKEEKAGNVDLGDQFNDEEDYKAIFEGLELGTEATRTGIIDNARKTGYIDLNKDVYTILPDGEYLIQALQILQINMDKYKTSEMGKALKKVFHNTMTVDESVKLAETEISEIFKTKSNDRVSVKTDIGFFGEVLGKCPLCGSDVVRNRFGYGCSGYKAGCKFKIGLKICSKIITVDDVRSLLENGKTEKLTGFISPKSGKAFDATLKLDGDKIAFDFS